MLVCAAVQRLESPTGEGENQQDHVPRFAELFPCCFAVKSAVNSPVNPLLIRCYGRTSSPVRAEFIAGSLGGERGFSAVSLPRGFRMRRGERRSAMLPQFKNPMIFLSENNKVCHDYFSRSERDAVSRLPLVESRKCLKTLNTARAGYWLQLACIWDRRHVRLGSAPFCGPFHDRSAVPIRPRSRASNP